MTQDNIPSEVVKMIEQEASKYMKEQGTVDKPFVIKHDFTSGATYAYKTFAEPLVRWKQESIEVMPPIQEIGKAIGVKLGESIHDKILPYINKLQQENEGLRNIIDRFKEEANKWLDKSKKQDSEIESLKKQIEAFKAIRPFFKKGSPLTDMMDKIIEGNKI